LLIATRRLLAAPRLIVFAALLAEVLISIVCHVYSSRVFVIEIVSCGWNKSAARVCRLFTSTIVPSCFAWRNQTARATVQAGERSK
jgi:hypothetical protein